MNGASFLSRFLTRTAISRRRFILLLASSVAAEPIHTEAVQQVKVMYYFFVFAFSLSLHRCHGNGLRYADVHSTQSATDRSFRPIHIDTVEAFDRMRLRIYLWRRPVLRVHRKQPDRSSANNNISMLVSDTFRLNRVSTLISHAELSCCFYLVPQPEDRPGNQSMGRLQRPSAQNRQWIDGEPGLPQFVGQNPESVRVPDNVCHRAWRRCHFKRLCIIHDVAIETRQKASVLQQRIGKCRPIGCSPAPAHDIDRHVSSRSGTSPLSPLSRRKSESRGCGRS